MKQILFLPVYWLISLIVLVRPVFDTVNNEDLHPSNNIQNGEEYQRFLEGAIDLLKEELCSYEEEFASLLQNSRAAKDEIYMDSDRVNHVYSVNRDHAYEKINNIERSMQYHFQKQLPSLEDLERNSPSLHNLNERVRKLCNTTIVLRKSIDYYEDNLNVFFREARRAIDEVYASGRSSECELITDNADEILSRLESNIEGLVKEVTCALPSDARSFCYRPDDPAFDCTEDD